MNQTVKLETVQNSCRNVENALTELHLETLHTSYAI